MRNPVNFPLDIFFIMDGSKRNLQGKCRFSPGFGNRKKSSSFRYTFWSSIRPDELVAVLAHEGGAFTKKESTSS